MLPISAENYSAFFSANAQIFGALLGLYGLAFVRIAETVEHNVGRMIQSLMDDFAKALKDSQFENSEISTSLIEFREVLGKFKGHLGESYAVFIGRHEEILNETNLRHELRQKFRINCWLALAMIFLSLLGILIPQPEYPAFTQYFALTTLVLAATALTLAVRFYLLVTETKMILTTTGQ